MTLLSGYPPRHPDQSWRPNGAVEDRQHVIRTHSRIRRLSIFSAPELNINTIRAWLGHRRSTHAMFCAESIEIKAKALASVDISGLHNWPHAERRATLADGFSLKGL